MSHTRVWLYEDIALVRHTGNDPLKSSPHYLRRPFQSYQKLGGTKTKTAGPGARRSNFQSEKES